MTETQNYKLKKPMENDYADIAAISENMELIDEALGGHAQDDTVHITAAERTAWNDADGKKHTHGNKSILDAITDVMVGAWNGITSHISDAVKHISGAERTAWNSKAEGVHVHNYAGSATAGGAATVALACSGNADSVDGFHFNWYDDGTHPSYLVGGNSSTTQVYPPSRLNVNYANGAGNSDTADGVHFSISPAVPGDIVNNRVTFVYG